MTARVPGASIRFVPARHRVPDSLVSAGQMSGAGGGSNPPPADYKKYGLVRHAR